MRTVGILELSNDALGIAQSSVQGEPRRQLLMLTTLYFGILFLESSVGHVPILMSNWQSPALLPAV